MNDGIIKGTGNSRYLKSSLDGINSWEDFKEALLAGTLPIDLNGINQAGWQQIGDALNKANLLDDAVCKILGLQTKAVPNDAFFALAMGDSAYPIMVTVLTDGGRPAVNVTVSGITTRGGGQCITGDDGTVIGFSKNPNVTLSTVSGYIDTTNVSKAATATSGAITNVVLKLGRVASPSKLFTSSTNFRFSPDVSNYDASAVGGGVNGGSGYTTGSNLAAWSSVYGGDGGAAGEVANVENIANTGTLITASVGSVGGGTSSISGVISARGGVIPGGAGGVATLTDSDRNNPFISTYSKSGANQPGTFKHPPTTVGAAGGGGGCYYGQQSSGGNGSSGGVPGGGNGSSDERYSGSAGVGYGAGGGGEYYHGFTGGRHSGAGSGVSGAVGIVWRYKS